MNSNSFGEQDSLQTRADVLLFINVSKVKVSRIRSVAQGIEAMVSGTMCRGFESLQMRFFCHFSWKNGRKIRIVPSHKEAYDMDDFREWLLR